jgi:hypothetical protein
MSNTACVGGHHMQGKNNYFVPEWKLLSLHFTITGQTQNFEQPRLLIGHTLRHGVTWQSMADSIALGRVFVRTSGRDSSVGIATRYGLDGPGIKSQRGRDFVGRGSLGGIATGYELDGPGIESRWGARFSAPIQTGPGTHPASCTMGTGSFPVVKSGRGVTLTPHRLLVPWSWKCRGIPLLTYGP